MLLGGWFLERQISIKVLWWLALAMMINAAFNLFSKGVRGQSGSGGGCGFWVGLRESVSSFS